MKTRRVGEAVLNVSEAGTPFAAPGRGDAALVVIPKNAWTDITARGGRELLLVARSPTSGNTATLTIWGSIDGGSTYFPVMKVADLTKARDVAIDVGTDRIGSGAFADALAVAPGPASSLYVQQEAAGTDDFTYLVGDL